MPTTPQDHKTKKTVGYKFTDRDGKSHVIPPITKARESLDGGAFEDAVLAGEIGMLGYMVKCLRLCGATPETLAALRKLPQDEYIETLKAWGDYGDGDGASLGE